LDSTASVEFQTRSTELISFKFSVKVKSPEALISLLLTKWFLGQCQSLCHNDLLYSKPGRKIICFTSLHIVLPSGLVHLRDRAQ
jgi:hypothetical protein